MYEPNRTTILVATCLLLAVLVVPAVQAQSIEIASGPAVAPEYTMRVDVSNFALVNFESRDSNQDGEGHIHYLVNGDPATEDLSYATPSETFTYEGLSVGDTVTARLVNNDHTPLDPKVQATQEVGAGTPGFTALAGIVGLVVALGLLRHRSS